MTCCDGFTKVRSINAIFPVSMRFENYCIETKYEEREMGLVWGRKDLEDYGSGEVEGGGGGREECTAADSEVGAADN